MAAYFPPGGGAERIGARAMAASVLASDDRIVALARHPGQRTGRCTAARIAKVAARMILVAPTASVTPP